jgi:hypothetical protein
MDDLDRYRLRQAARWRKLRSLGVRNIRCTCGETDPLCFDLEHVERKRVSDFVWGTCKNCHAKKSVHEGTENPALPPVMNPIEKAGHALLGMVAYLEAITERLRQIAELLFSLARLGIKLDG